MSASPKEERHFICFTCSVYENLKRKALQFLYYFGYSTGYCSIQREENGSIFLVMLSFFISSLFKIYVPLCSCTREIKYRQQGSLLRCDVGRELQGIYILKLISHFIHSSKHFSEMLYTVLEIQS